MNLPEADIKIRERAVLDILRRKFVTLTPEEWVRQNFIHYLIEHKGYPAALLANEVELRIGEKKLRCDSVLFGQDRQPRMIMEYKAESIPITPKVLQQVATYNMLLHVNYLIASNGNTHIALHYNKDTDRWENLSHIPEYDEIKD